jgi:hypothetical protein
MAEIKLERKGTPIWPWILGLLLLAALLWYFLTRNNDGATTTGDTTAAVTSTDTGAMAGAAAGAGTAGVEGAPGGEEDFIQFVDRGDTSGETEANHQYTANGIRRLAAMLQRNAGSGANAGSGPWITMSMLADSLQTTGAGDDRHADMAKRAFQLALGAMGSGTGTAEARSAADAIDTARPLGEQTAQVRTFFERTRDAMRAMPNAGAR